MSVDNIPVAEIDLSVPLHVPGKNTVLIASFSVYLSVLIGSLWLVGVQWCGLMEVFSCLSLMVLVASVLWSSSEF